MALPRRIPVTFELAFPSGAYAVGEVTAVRDYDRSTKERPVQAADPETGLLLWQVEGVDADADARKSNRTMTVKVAARVQPVLPDRLPGLPFSPVEFEKLTATAWVEEVGEFSRIAWSFHAGGVRAPSHPVRGLSEPKPAEKAS